jgi:hypothetical protein
VPHLMHGATRRVDIVLLTALSAVLSCAVLCCAVQNGMACLCEAEWCCTNSAWAVAVVPGVLCRCGCGMHDIWDGQKLTTVLS